MFEFVLLLDVNEGLLQARAHQSVLLIGCELGGCRIIDKRYNMGVIELAAHYMEISDFKYIFNFILRESFKQHEIIILQYYN